MDARPATARSEFLLTAERSEHRSRHTGWSSRCAGRIRERSVEQVALRREIVHMSVRREGSVHPAPSDPLLASDDPLVTQALADAGGCGPHDLRRCVRDVGAHKVRPRQATCGGTVCYRNKHAQEVIKSRLGAVTFAHRIHGNTQ